MILGKGEKGGLYIFTQCLFYRQAVFSARQIGSKRPTIEGGWSGNIACGIRKHFNQLARDMELYHGQKLVSVFVGVRRVFDEWKMG